MTTSGELTFVFTDIEGSTSLWERDRASMGAALADHDRLLRDAIDAHGGRVFATGGDGDYFGPTLNRAARLMSIAHGGQVLCSAATAHLLDGVPLVELGRHRLRDLSAPIQVSQVGESASSRRPSVPRSRRS